MIRARSTSLPAVVTSLTVARMAAIPAIMALVLAGDDHRSAYPAAAALFVAAALTDLLDGYLARRWRVTSSLGSFLDTTADKLLVTGTLIVLVAVGRASPWFATIIVGREFVIMALRGVVATGGGLMSPSLWGKLKANVQFVALAVAILRPQLMLGPWFVDEWLLFAATVVTVLSALDYLVRSGRAFRPGGSR